MTKMKNKLLLLVIGLTICLACIAIILLKGSPKDEVNLDSIVSIGENLIHHVDKTGQIITAITEEEEMQIGNKIHSEMIAPYYDKIEDVDIVTYVSEVGNQMTQRLKRKGIDYKFHIIKSSYPAAFASSGGHIYITDKMLESLESEAELADILGHEMTHVDAKHCIGMIQYKVLAEKMTGSGLDELAEIGYRLLITPAYSEFQEEEADCGGAYLAYISGYHPLKGIYALKRIYKEYSRQNVQDKSLTPIGDTIGAIFGAFNRYFNTHPPDENRVENVQKYVTANGLKGKSYVGKKNYQDKKSKLKILHKDEYENVLP